MFVHEKITGIDRERLIAAVEPVLRAHHVEGVELFWKTDSRGWLLQVTVEVPSSARPGDGVTLELCSEISRDLSAALDVADVISVAYRLEVGSPGLERALYVARDYDRFRGQLARIKLKQPVNSEYVFRGVLFGLDEAGRVVIDTDQGQQTVAMSNIDSAHLVLDMKAAGLSGQPKNQTTKSHTAKGNKAKGATAKGAQRKRPGVAGRDR